MTDPIIGCRFHRAGPQSIFEDAAGCQYVLGDEGRRVYGVYLIPEEECLRTAASARRA